jgi:D-arabinan exo alpha-(1,3)/(1,5)-arabinofuranosidase (non-reducing end)
MRHVCQRYSHSVLLILFLLAVIFLTVRFWSTSNPNEITNACATARELQGVVAATTHSQAFSPLYLGLDAYRYLDKLSYLELGDRVEGASTADPGGSNIDNRHVVRVLPDGEHVLFDQSGPGIMTFMRMQENLGGPWNLSLDGHFTTTVHVSDLGQTNPVNSPANTFPYPLSLNPQQSQGSSIVATSIPFQQSMQWTSQHAIGNFYALYRKLPYGSTFPTWNGVEPVNDVVRLLRCAGSDIVPQSISQQHGNLALTDRRETPLLTLNGPAEIRALEFQVPPQEMVGFGNARLLIYWNGETHPSVDAPIKFLAGDGAGIYFPRQRQLVQGWIAGMSQDQTRSMNVHLYWPMPFSSHARIAILAASPLHALHWSVRYEPFPDPPRWWATFHATYVSVAKPPPGDDMTFLDVKGSGKLVGTIINFSVPDNTLEGDPHIYLDDSKTPQIAVTGTEEWGLGGNYWNGGQQVSLPLGGLPSSINNPPGTNIDGAALYRFLIADSIPFNRHLIVRWEHGGENESMHSYRATMLWYGTSTQTALLSDNVLTALPASRLAHHYIATGEHIYQLNAAYEYAVHAPLTTGSGTLLTGAASFTMQLDPHNVGAFLRRTFDDCVGDQRANIYLDGSFAGTWYDAGISNGVGVDGHHHCWRDEDYPLPASLTAGKSSVQVHIVFLHTSEPQNRDWTAFRYSMYSFVLPALPAS